MLKSGFPPIVIPNKKRQRYIKALVKYELTVGQPHENSELLPKHESILDFESLCADSWNQTLKLIDEAHQLMSERYPKQ